MPVMCPPSMTDGEKPGADDWTAGRTTSRRGRRRARRRRWRGSVLRLKEVSHVTHRIDGDRFRTTHRRHRRDDGVLVRRILSHDGDVAVTSGRDVHQLLRRIPAERIDALPVGDRRYDSPGGGIDYNRRLAATGENPVRRPVERDTRRSLARRQRPRG